MPDEQLLEAGDVALGLPGCGEPRGAARSSSLDGGGSGDDTSSASVSASASASVTPASSAFAGSGVASDALAEQNEGARPAYEADVDPAPYKTVYLGYPIWWGDLPMCLYAFLEAHDWSGKDIRPFCTHAGSGLAGTVASVGATRPGANVGPGLAIEGTTAQNSRDGARSAVEAWLA